MGGVPRVVCHRRVLPLFSVPASANFVTPCTSDETCQPRPQTSGHAWIGPFLYEYRKWIQRDGRPFCLCMDNRVEHHRMGLYHDLARKLDGDSIPVTSIGEIFLACRWIFADWCGYPSGRVNGAERERFAKAWRPSLSVPLSNKLLRTDAP